MAPKTTKSRLDVHDCPALIWCPQSARAYGVYRCVWRCSVNSTSVSRHKNNHDMWLDSYLKRCVSRSERHEKCAGKIFPTAKCKHKAYGFYNGQKAYWSGTRPIRYGFYNATKDYWSGIVWTQGPSAMVFITTRKLTDPVQGPSAMVFITARKLTWSSIV